VQILEGLEAIAEGRETGNAHPMAPRRIETLLELEARAGQLLVFVVLAHHSEKSHDTVFVGRLERIWGNRFVGEVSFEQSP
jgi:hypothetical protein